MGLSEFLRKTFVSQTSSAREAGQAVIEYLLVLVVTVALILGLMYQFNDAFKQFLDAYFGDYIACLLETGELPSMGGSGPNQSQCRSPFQNFDLQAGNSMGPTSGSGSDSSRGGNSGSGSDSASSGSDSDSGSSGGRSNRSLRRSRVSRSGGAANGEFAGSSSSKKGRPSSQRLNNRADSNARGGFDSKSSEGTIGGRRGRTIRRRRVVYLGESYLSDKQKKKDKDPIVGKGKKPKKGTGTSNLRKPSFALAVPEPNKMKSEVEGSGFNFSTMIKFLLIAGILIAIFLFLGGQAMQIKKSWEKSE